MFCYKQYLTKLLKVKDEVEGLYFSLKDKKLEKAFNKTYNEKHFENNTFKLSLCIIFPYVFFILYTTFINQFPSRISYSFISGIVLEVLISKLSYRFKDKNRCFGSMKILRFFLGYINVSINAIFSTAIIDENLIRFSFIFILYVNITQFLFLELNIVLQIVLPTMNAIVFVSFQLARDKVLTFLLPEIFINFICFYASYLIKKFRWLDKKKVFCESYQTQLYHNYIQNLIDVMECMVIGIKDREILFMNNFALKFLKKFLLIKNDQLNAENNNNNEVLLVHQIQNEPDRFMNMFFQSLFLFKSFDKNFKEGAIFKDVLDEITLNNTYLSTNFNKIGYFCSNFDEELYLEIYVRKLIFKEEAIEILVYNVSDVKKAEKEAVESSIKNKILAKIAHEFKTPLLTIISLINKINSHLNSNNNEDCKNKLQYICSLSGYTIILINDIIQYASNFTNLKMNINQINLREVLEFSYNVLNTFVECNESKSNRIKTSLDYDVNIDQKNVFSDEIRLKQIILNFISNAYKFKISGFIKLKAKYIEHSDIIEISVKDSGIGIKRENQDQIFQENVQINYEKEYNYQGTGLGLSISKNIANSLNYEIGFFSEYEVGSTFYIRIKCNEVYEIKGKKTTNFFRKIINNEDKNKLNLNNVEIKTHRSVRHITSSNKLVFSNMIEEDLELTKRICREDLIKCEELEVFESEENFIESNSPVSTASKQYKILVVDDHKFVRDNTINIINSCLNELGYFFYEVVEYSDGLDILNAVRLDKEKRIKLIFTDENMEYLNGSEAVQILRKFEDNKRINFYPIISITAFDDKISKNRILSSGINTILSKPCSKTAIYNILIKFLNPHI
jgi:signal transduction histidine kinase/CheY-like chemotaxis protein